MNCFFDVKFVIVYFCDGVCYFGNKKCFFECLEFYLFVFKLKYFYYCLNKCLLFIVVNNRKCELLCLFGCFYFYSGWCFLKCFLIYFFVMLWNLFFNEIFVCIDWCYEGMGFYKNVCVLICLSKLLYEYYGKCVFFCGKDWFYVNIIFFKKFIIYY